jgi:hypothetical protein
VEVQQRGIRSSLVENTLWKSDTEDTGNDTYAQILDSGQFCVFPKAPPQSALPLMKPPAELCFGPTSAAYTADAGDKSKYSLQLYTQLSNYSTAAFNKSAFELAVVDAVYTLRTIEDAAAVAVTVTDSNVVAASARRLLAHDSDSSTTSIYTQQQQAHRAAHAAALAADASAVLLVSYNVRNIRGAAAAAAVLTQLQSPTGSTALRYSFSNRTNFTGVTTLGVSTTPQNIKVPFTQQRDSSTSTGVIVGAVIGVVIVAAAAVGCIMYRRMRKHRRATTVSAKLSPQRKSSLSSMTSMNDSSRAPRHTVADSSSSSSYEHRSSSVPVPLHSDDSSCATIDEIEQQRADNSSEYVSLGAIDTTDSSSTVGESFRPQQRAAAASMRTAIITRCKVKAVPAAALADTTKSTGTTAAAAALTSSSGNSAAVKAVPPGGGTAGAVVATTRPVLAGRSGYTQRAIVLVGNMSSGLTSAMQRGVEKHGAKAELLWEGIGKYCISFSITYTNAVLHSIFCMHHACYPLH